jgi:hypothetical protein
VRSSLQFDWNGNRRAFALRRLIGTWIDSLRHGRAQLLAKNNELFFDSSDSSSGAHEIVD